ncbi:MAG: hypothetical protein MPL62_11410 [Alphaproteobacteria bacterium]|nr:hypothetical protein [Alphaproteobacteria bacterium]
MGDSELPEVVAKAVENREIDPDIAERAAAAKQFVRDGTPDHGCDVLDLARRIQSNIDKPGRHFVPLGAKKEDLRIFDSSFDDEISVGLGRQEMSRLDRYVKEYFYRDRKEAARSLVIAGLRESESSKGDLVLDNELYSMLLSSIKNSGTGLKRVLSPVQCAKLIKRLVDRVGYEDVELILPVTDSTIRDFVRLLDLPTDYHERVIWGATGDNGVTFSSAAEIARLEDDGDKSALFGFTVEKRIPEMDVHRIVTLYKEDPGRHTMDEAIRICVEEA